ncbi:expansin-B2-like [Lolium rigidum]|uniref:expansin-B2-like n=1 Tax=Lolium rigidum TaxID=89674 RepID=UPI001F5DA92E|nr:expansin-B2-like [Lolium rigidum]XP_051199483.1 expansin-B2-like [Lolium perenne]
MAGVTTNTVALVALLSMLVTSVRSGTTYSSTWLPAKATWYGKPNGAGPDNGGGACNFKNSQKAPFFSMTSCGNQALFKDGAGCGACYQIKCNKNNYPECSNVAKTVVITDINDGPMAKYHFDLSGTAFGAMALPGRNAQLRRAGKISIQFRRVPCNWPGVKITFYILKGANPYYFPVMPEHLNGDGTVVKMEVMRSKDGRPTKIWEPMYRSVGAVWRRDSGNPLKGPLSLRITSDSGKKLIANNVIPAGWKGGNGYTSKVQFY